MLACVEAIHAAIGFGYFVIQCRVVGQDVVYRQVVPLADVVIIEVMGRRNLDAACAELRIDIVIGDDRNTAANDRQNNFLSDEILVALIVRMHRNGTIAQHRLGPRCGDNKMTVARGKRVAEVPQVTLLVGRENLEVRQRCVQGRVPVDEALATINETVFVQ